MIEFDLLKIRFVSHVHGYSNKVVQVRVMYLGHKCMYTPMAMAIDNRAARESTCTLFPPTLLIDYCCFVSIFSQSQMGSMRV